eukprot:TRINITY_DN54937_c0_g1_i1.p1 TRINITY_DN54937_c0_g1~~TRINITY_DN54937_c0_g1_i1.p1  ORF type:complete len:279 (+),score=53.35 TRINITY_DN54937_c0_g1_i1:35-871(+)
MSVCVRFGDHCYETLDSTRPNKSRAGFQKEFLPLPKGWEVAPDEEDIVANVIAKHPWGTHVLVVASGAGYYTTSLGTDDAGSMYSTDLLESKNGFLKPRTSALRILIRKPLSARKRKAFVNDMVQTLWTTKSFADCDVVCDSVSTRCHCAILAAASPVLSAMLSGEMQEAKRRRVEVQSFEPKVVESFLRFIYTGEFTDECDHLIDLMVLADFYQVVELVEACCEELKHSLTADNIVKIIRTVRNSRDKSERLQAYWKEILKAVATNESLLECMALGL